MYKIRRDKNIIELLIFFVFLVDLMVIINMIYDTSVANETNMAIEVCARRCINCMLGPLIGLCLAVRMRFWTKNFRMLFTRRISMKSRRMGSFGHGFVVHCTTLRIKNLGTTIIRIRMVRRLPFGILRVAAQGVWFCCYRMAGERGYVLHYLRLIGGVQLRQARVTNTSCQERRFVDKCIVQKIDGKEVCVPRFDTLDGTCFAEYSAVDPPFPPFGPPGNETKYKYSTGLSDMEYVLRTAPCFFLL